MQTITQILAAELGCAEKYVQNVVALLDEGNTIPFIARYRKEAHGGRWKRGCNICAAWRHAVRRSGS